MAVICCFHNLMLELDSTATDRAAVNAPTVLPLTPPLPVSSLTLPPHQRGRGGNIVSSTHLHCSIRCSTDTQYLNWLWTTSPRHGSLHYSDFYSLLAQPHHSPPFLPTNVTHHGFSSSCLPIPYQASLPHSYSLAGLQPPMSRLGELILPFACTLEIFLSCSVVSLELQGQMLPDPVCASYPGKCWDVSPLLWGLALITHPLCSCSSQPRSSPSIFFFAVRLIHKSKLIKPASLEDCTHLIPALSFCSRL